MTREEYQDTQANVLTIARIALLLPLEEFVAAIDHADAVGPILDPTLYRAGMGKMQQVRELAVAVQRVQRIAGRHLTEVES